MCFEIAFGFTSIDLYLIFLLLLSECAKNAKTFFVLGAAHTLATDELFTVEGVAFEVSAEACSVWVQTLPLSISSGSRG